jgi:hypothetical protein
MPDWMFALGHERTSEDAASCPLYPQKRTLLAKLVRDRPADLLKVIASLLPKEIDIDQALTVNLKVLAERDFGQAFAFALKHIGSERQELIEANDSATAD